jgi:uncharacterized protein (DUF2141 family)
MRFSLSKFLIALLLTSMFFNCARRGTPTGGLKDSLPPILVKAIPAIESINFKEKRIKIFFDEYIKIADVKKNLVISPPQKNDPLITPVGTASKFITIKILDTLDSNTTYSFNFGNSIVDNNEGNKLGNFKYVFSTGSYIDSLFVTGEVTKPRMKKPLENIDVMLYEYDSVFNDSIIFKQKPRYLANTLDTTLFEITNIRAGKYLLIALKDANHNKIYNPEIDEIGFVKDTITIPTDKKYNFTIFKEIPDLKVIKPREVNKGHLIFGYEGNTKDLKIELLTKTPKNFESKLTYEKGKDTLNYWYTPFENDSLIFKVSKGDDYSENFILKTRSSKIDSLNITKSTNSTLHLIDTFSINTTTPITTFNKSQIKITNQDSINVEFNAYLSKNSSKLYLDFEKKINSEYTFEILPKSITDIFEASNDSLSFKLKTKALENYGILNLDVQSSKSSALIIELLDEKENLIRIVKIEKPQLVKFDLLLPKKYVVRVTFDENNNGIWDTGSFLEKRQPEIVKYFKTPIEVRENWEINDVLILN